MDAALSFLIDRIRAAAADRQPLRIRGGGSKDFYGEPGGPSQVLSTTDLRGIVNYERNRELLLQMPPSVAEATRIIAT